MDSVSPRRGAVAGMTKRCKDGVPRARRTGGVSMMRFGERRRVATAVVAAAAALLLPAAAAAQDAGPVTAGVTFFTGPNFTGSSKTLTLEPDQHYAAIPYVGNELNEDRKSTRLNSSH